MRRQGNISCSSKYDGACIARGVLTLDSRVTTVSRSDAKSSRISARHQSFLRRRRARAASLINCTAHRTQQRDGRQWSARLWAGAHGQAESCGCQDCRHVLAVDLLQRPTWLEPLTRRRRRCCNCFSPCRGRYLAISTRLNSSVRPSHIDKLDI